MAANRQLKPITTRAPHTLDEVLGAAREALAWTGSLPSGRLAATLRCSTEFLEQGQCSEEHIHAFRELIELVDIYQSWQPYIDKYPGLKEKIGKSFNEGPILRENEKLAPGSHRSRNDLFIYYLAARLLSSEIPVTSIDGIPRHGTQAKSTADICIEIDGLNIDIEGKRPLREDALGRRAREARSQLTNQVGHGNGGIICH